MIFSLSLSLYIYIYIYMYTKKPDIMMTMLKESNKHSLFGKSYLTFE